jgi:hypothetical protein
MSDLSHARTSRASDLSRAGEIERDVLDNTSDDTRVLLIFTTLPYFKFNIKRNRVHLHKPVVYVQVWRA